MTMEMFLFVFGCIVATLSLGYLANLGVDAIKRKKKEKIRRKETDIYVD